MKSNNPAQNLALVAQNEKCDICENRGVVVIGYPNDSYSNLEMCGVCTFGESSCLKWSEWADGEFDPAYYGLTNKLRKVIYDTLREGSKL